MLQERCQLYQMKDGKALREYIFQPFAVLASKRYFPNEADYDMAYDDLLRPNEDVRAVRERLSMLQRKRGCFRQINTSDVIVLRRETGTICCFVDGDGFVMLDGFFGPPSSICTLRSCGKNWKGRPRSARLKSRLSVKDQSLAKKQSRSRRSSSSTKANRACE